VGGGLVSGKALTINLPKSLVILIKRKLFFKKNFYRSINDTLCTLYAITLWMAVMGEAIRGHWAGGAGVFWGTAWGLVGPKSRNAPKNMI
jgi:hypothetical protein